MKRAITALVLLALSAAAHAKDDGKDQFAACRADMEKYCKNVQPGEGRQVQCMIQNKSRLSGDCAKIVSKKEQHMAQWQKQKENKPPKPQ
jgi:hypothetical protein